MPNQTHGSICWSDCSGRGGAGRTIFILSTSSDTFHLYHQPKINSALIPVNFLLCFPRLIRSRDQFSPGSLHSREELHHHCFHRTQEGQPGAGDQTHGLISAQCAALERPGGTQSSQLSKADQTTRLQET